MRFFVHQQFSCACMSFQGRIRHTFKHRHASVLCTCSGSVVLLLGVPLCLLCFTPFRAKCNTHNVFVGACFLGMQTFSQIHLFGFGAGTCHPRGLLVSCNWIRTSETAARKQWPCCNQPWGLLVLPSQHMPTICEPQAGKPSWYFASQHIQTCRMLQDQLFCLGTDNFFRFEAICK